MDNQSRIVDALFQTRALRISPPDEPFFYTSEQSAPTISIRISCSAVRRMQTNCFR